MSCRSWKQIALARHKGLHRIASHVRTRTASSGLIPKGSHTVAGGRAKRIPPERMHKCGHRSQRDRIFRCGHGSYATALRSADASMGSGVVARSEYGGCRAIGIRWLSRDRNTVVFAALDHRLPYMTALRSMGGCSVTGKLATVGGLQLVPSTVCGNYC